MHRSSFFSFLCYTISMRKPATFTFTVVQHRLLTEHGAKTGLQKVEIVRRALDEYFSEKAVCQQIVDSYFDPDESL